MNPRELFALQGVDHPPQRQLRKLSGFSVEHVRPELGAAFSYDWTSDLHLCAYHDIVLKDGGVRAGDNFEDNRRDLRQTLTYVPRGARVTGWSELSGRANSFTAIYFDPAAIREELGTRFAERVDPRVYYRSDEVAGYLRQWARLLGQGHLALPLFRFVYHARHLDPDIRRALRSGYWMDRLWMVRRSRIW